ncbi:MAG TPA: glutathionylspermidine synthase family protein [Tepidisphaeraceae bacterium]|jgi:glutathionylspermidine synthase|nr:glutathionylspermidine synthase family protein [Tepidisphaeraceae bacterium]
MRRLQIQPRANWQQTVESFGFHFHTINDVPYWDESAYYEFASAEIDTLEKATYELDKMCLAAAQHVIDEKQFDRFQIPPAYVPWLMQSWERDEHTICGRFDLSYGGGGTVPKLLEYNADTPTSLLEASVIQWQWMKDRHPKLDQFNSIHERLIEAWAAVRPSTRGAMYFTCVGDNVEDFMTTTYLRDTAMQAGLDTRYVDIEKVGWNFDRRLFVDEAELHISDCFKLYPWEWLIRERFANMLLNDNTRWLEAPWKMLLSNKAILPMLHELFPQSPYILAAAFEPVGRNYVKKPVLGREGANVEVIVDGKTILSTPGEYGEPFVYQEYAPPPGFDGHHPVIGSWMVNGYACGIGIREDMSPVTQNTSRFVPHVFGT